jgi:hypothetical protein
VLHYIDARLRRLMDERLMGPIIQNQGVNAVQDEYTVFWKGRDSQSATIYDLLAMVTTVCASSENPYIMLLPLVFVVLRCMPQCLGTPCPQPSRIMHSKVNHSDCRMDRFLRVELQLAA